MQLPTSLVTITGSRSEDCGSPCGLLPLQPICFNISCDVCSTFTELLLPSCQLKAAILLWHQQKHFHPKNCHSLFFLFLAIFCKPWRWLCGENRFRSELSQILTPAQISGTNNRVMFQSHLSHLPPHVHSQFELW